MTSPAPPSASACSPAGPRLPHVAQRDLVDIEIDKKASCSDGRGSLTELFFPDEPVELARARAICTACSVRDLCLHRASPAPNRTGSGVASCSSPASSWRRSGGVVIHARCLALDSSSTRSRRAGPGLRRSRPLPPAAATAARHL
ncbi:MAG: WhiB family transcriptional regulator [Acidimicrobiia bacterium]|nr:WhiB family transcriptional regulator [Acidimicrobiia bacterium]